MKKLILVVAAASVLCSTAAMAATKPTSQPQPNARYLVVFKSDTLPADAASRIRNSGGEVTRVLGQIGVVTARGDAAFAAKIGKDTKVLAVGPEQMFAAPDDKAVQLTDTAVPDAGPEPADTYYPGYQWDIRRVGAPAVWSRLPLSAAAARVAVLDVGVMDTHPDLAGQVDTSVATSYCATSGGYPSYTTFIDFDSYPNWTPADGCSALGGTIYQTHGTHVAGTIAAKFGGGRVVGVAPDAKIGAYKVFDLYLFEGDLYVGAFDGPLFDAIIQATGAGYRVISMSLGSYGVRNDKSYNASWLAWDRVAKWANRNGALIVASAGNTPISLNGALFHMPSDLPTVMSTSASATSQLVICPGPAYCAAPGSDYLASYSSYGAAVDIAAPGGDCNPNDLANCTSSSNLRYWILNAGILEAGPNVGLAGYYFMQGTSMATPHVSAVAAWVFAMHPDWTPGDVRSWLKDTAEAIGSRQQFGHGMVNADTATQ